MLSVPPWQALSNICNDAHARAWVSLQADLLLASNTVNAYARGLDHYLGFCCRTDITMTNAGRAQIASYTRALVQPQSTAAGIAGLSNASIRHRLTIVRLFYDYLIEEGVRTTNPVARGRRGAVVGGRGVGERGLIPVQRRLPWIPDDAQWRALLSAAAREPVRNRLMLAFAYDCALRREELCSLATGDIDPARRLLRVRAETTKTKRDRVVPYSVVSSDLYIAYLAERRRLGSARGPLFLSESTRNRAAPMTKWTWSKVVRRLALRAGVPKLTTHSFRHLCLTDLARAGWDIEEIASFAGHRSIQSTLLYIHLSAQDLADRFARSMAAVHEERLHQLRGSAP
ncbi:tyrosine-type recombinase/integrase [Delftia sp. WSY_7]|jgi:integrase/recombinase XerD|uniref:tyrosine-type recombinase/integrase n=1 Tax=Delftia sp. WSY_7 TaxID=3367202 RepID=UPI003709EDDE